VTGDPAGVKEHCRKLIEICAPGGGYILAAGCIPDNPKLENIQAMHAAALEYGVYSK
jgi:uroporphyrinogen-III decarboxylase